VVLVEFDGPDELARPDVGAREAELSFTSCGVGG
jgi:hypothetical protein